MIRIELGCWLCACGRASVGVCESRGGRKGFILVVDAERLLTTLELFRGILLVA